MKASLIRKERRIPVRGEVFVKVGDAVSSDTLIARCIVPNPDIRELKVYSYLDVDPEQARDYMLKGVGDAVDKDEVIAIKRSFFGRQTKVARSPLDGVIESFAYRSGRVLIRGNPLPVEVVAHVPGKVAEVIEGEGAVVEANGFRVEGVFGVGGEARGAITVATEDPDTPLTSSDIKESYGGSVVVGGSLVTLDALKAAQRVGVKGVVAGGVDQKDLTYFLGREIGLGITGHEELGLTLILLGGFGVNPIDQKAFEFFREVEGRLACLDGTTQIRSRALRPEIIVPDQ
ncbi:MAG TPA: hypothetical protein VGB32_08930 [Candidatus Bathyarchaeia archaeon]